MSVKRGRSRLLSASRCANKSKSQPIAAHKARTIVRRHHALSKQLQQAQVKGDKAAVCQIDKEIEANGGLQKYQTASLSGQAVDRGGDSSKVLVQWLKEHLPAHRHAKLRMLEIGALCPDNACFKSGIFEMDRIDLHSQHPLIREQDFMQLSAPQDAAETGFDVISLSLVLNFVGDAGERGLMLSRLSEFVRPCPSETSESLRSYLPALFLVLPAPCVLNSRYLDGSRLLDIMASLGWKPWQEKISSKLIYSLWTHVGSSKMPTSFPKVEVRPGRNRNNFAITLRSRE